MGRPHPASTQERAPIQSPSCNTIPASVTAARGIRPRAGSGDGHRSLEEIGRSPPQEQRPRRPTHRERPARRREGSEPEALRHVETLRVPVAGAGHDTSAPGCCGLQPRPGAGEDGAGEDPRPAAHWRPACLP
jgi:hypothetical protein